MEKGKQILTCSNLKPAKNIDCGKSELNREFTVQNIRVYRKKSKLGNYKISIQFDSDTELELNEILKVTNEAIPSLQFVLSD